MEPRKRLGEILLQMGLVTPEKIEEALTHARRTGGRLGEALVDLKMATEEQIARALCRQNKLPFVDLEKSKLPADVIDLVDTKTVAEYRMVPVKKQGRQVICAIGSSPSCWTMMAAPSADMRPRPRWLSVRLIASTARRIPSASRSTVPRAAPFGGASSPVTTIWPACRRR